MTARKANEDVIDLRAVNPDGDLACDFTIASDMARSGIREALQAGLLPPVRLIPGGIEATFRPDAWQAVRRYVELESKCCAFLSLAAQRSDDTIMLTVTGRPEAQDLIRGIFRDA